MGLADHARDMASVRAQGGAAMSTIKINAIRQRGAKARSLGIGYFCNPFTFKEMLPAATGESAEVWRQKLSAWWEG
jgi:hypothetical protein